MPYLTNFNLSSTDSNAILDKLLSSLNNYKEATHYINWLDKHPSAKKLSKLQQLVLTLEIINAKWAEHCHRYPFPNMSLFVVDLIHAFSDQLKSTSSTNRNPDVMTAAAQLVDAVNLILAKGLFKPNLDKGGIAKTKLQLIPLLEHLANWSERHSTVQDKKTETDSKDTFVGAFELSKIQHRLDIKKILNLMLLYIEDVDFIADAIAALGRLASTRFRPWGAIGSNIAVDAFCDRVTTAASAKTISHWLDGINHLIKAELLQTRVDAHKLNNVLKILAKKSAKDSNASKPILDCMRCLADLAENVAILHIEALNTEALQNILCQHIRSNPSSTDLAAMFKSVSRVHYLSGHLKPISFDLQLTVLKVSLEQNTKVFSKLLSSQSTEHATLPLTQLADTISSILLSAGEIMKMDFSYKKIANTDYIKCVEGLFDLFEKIAQTLLAQSEKKTKKKPMEQDVEQKRRVADKAFLDHSMIKNMIRVLRASPLLGSGKKREYLFSEVLRHKNLIMEVEPTTRLKHYASPLALYTLVSRSRLPEELRQDIIRNKPKEYSPDELRQEIARGESISPYYKLVLDFVIALEKAHCSDIRVEKGLLYPLDISATYKNIKINIELDGTKFHIRKSRDEFRDGALRWAKVVDYISRVDLTFKCDPDAIVESIIKNAKTSQHLPHTPDMDFYHLLAGQAPSQSKTEAQILGLASNSSIKEEVKFIGQLPKTVDNLEMKEPALKIQDTLEVNRFALDEKKYPISENIDSLSNKIKKIANKTKISPQDLAELAVNGQHQIMNEMLNRGKLHCGTQLYPEVIIATLSAVIGKLKTAKNTQLEKPLHDTAQILINQAQIDLLIKLDRDSPLVEAVKEDQQTILDFIKNRLATRTSQAPKKKNKGKRNKNIQPTPSPKSWEEILNDARKTIADSKAKNTPSTLPVTNTQEPISRQFSVSPKSTAASVMADSLTTKKSQLKTDRSGSFFAYSDKDMPILYRLVEEGHAGAQTSLACSYEQGRGVEKNLPEAVRLYTLAAEQGYASAQNNLGSCYRDGIGVNQDLKEAIRFWDLSAKQGCKEAQYNLGHAYSIGCGVEKNTEKAVQFYLLAAEQGCAAALGELAYYYETGEGVTKNLQEAIRLYHFAAQQGDALAQYILGRYYAEGKGVEKDLKQAARYYALSADQGYEYAQYSLGCCYKKGEGVEKDLKQAAKYYALSAAQGSAESQFVLGNLYFSGEGVNKDINEAIKFFQLSVKQGHSYAQVRLGCCYANGEGVGQDLQEAARLLRLSAEQGNELAKQYLLKLTAKLSYPYSDFFKPITLDIPEVKKQKVDQSISEKQKAIISNQLGVAEYKKNNFQLAVKYFQQCADYWTTQPSATQENQKAQFCLGSSLFSLGECHQALIPLEKAYQLQDPSHRKGTKYEERLNSCREKIKSTEQTTTPSSSPSSKSAGY